MSSSRDPPEKDESRAPAEPIGRLARRAAMPMPVNRLGVPPENGRELVEGESPVLDETLSASDVLQVTRPPLGKQPDGDGPATGRVTRDESVQIMVKEVRCASRLMLRRAAHETTRIRYLLRVRPESR